MNKGFYKKIKAIFNAIIMLFLIGQTVNFNTKELAATAEYISDVDFIRADRYQTMIVTENGKNVFTAGNNDNRALAQVGSSAKEFYQVSTSMIKGKIIDGSISGTNSLLLNDAGEVYITGSNYYGQHANGVTGGTQSKYVKLDTSNITATGAKAVNVMSGWHSTYILDSNNVLWGAGSDYYGQLGRGLQTTSSLELIQLLEGVKQISIVANTEMEAAVALKLDGTVWYAGQDLYGASGKGSAGGNVTTWFEHPIKDVKQVNLSSYNLMLLTNGGELFATGNNQWGYFGMGLNSGNYSTPQNISEKLRTSTINGETRSWDVKRILPSQTAAWVELTDGTIWSSGTNNGSWGDLGYRFENRSANCGVENECWFHQNSDPVQWDQESARGAVVYKSDIASTGGIDINSPISFSGTWEGGIMLDKNQEILIVGNSNYGELGLKYDATPKATLFKPISIQRYIFNPTITFQDRAGNVITSEENTAVENPHTVVLGIKQFDIEVAAPEVTIDYIIEKGAEQIKIGSETVKDGAITINVEALDLVAGEYTITATRKTVDGTLTSEKYTENFISTGKIPEITITPEIMIVDQNSNHDVLNGVKGTDVEDITTEVTTTDTLDTTTTGLKSITYTTTDTNNNTVTKTRKYIVKATDERVSAGKTHYIIAKNFAKTVGQVSTEDTDIITHATAKAYTLADGTETAVTVSNKATYTNVVGVYVLEFAAADEVTTKIAIDATVKTGNAPSITVDPAIVVVDINEEVNLLTGVVGTDVEDTTTEVTTQALDTTTPGLKTVEYTATDNDKNTTTATRTYIVKAVEEKIIVGKTHYVIAKDFAKAVSQVSMKNTDIIAHATAKAYTLANGTETAVTVSNKGTYTNIAGVYPLEFAAADEVTTTLTIDATVTTGNAPVITVNPEISVINTNEKINLLEGVDATDTEDITTKVTTTQTLDTTTPGLKTVEYTTTDKDNNTTTATRTYIVKAVEEKITVGTTHYIIAKDFTTIVSQVSTQDTDIIAHATAKAYKLADGAETAVTVSNKGTYTNVAGVYPLEFTAADEVTTTLTIDATVTTGNAPVITVNPAIITINTNDSINLLEGVVATDTEDITTEVTTTQTLDTTKTGLKTVEYTTTDSDNNTTTTTRTYIIKAVEEKITVGPTHYIIAKDFSKTTSQVSTQDPDIIAHATAKAYTLADGTETAVTVSNKGTYTNVAGVYPLEFAAADEVTTTLTIDATVTTGNAPVITVNPAIIVVNTNDGVNLLAGINGTDVEDITTEVTATQTLDTTKAGLKTVEYTTTDSDNNTTTATRTYIIKAVEEHITVGPTHYIIAKDFTKTTSQVSTQNPDIIAHATAKAYTLANGTETAVTVSNKGTYTNLAGEYTLEFAATDELTTTIEIIATILKEELPTTPIEVVKSYEISGKDITININDYLKLKENNTLEQHIRKESSVKVIEQPTNIEVQGITLDMNELLNANVEVGGQYNVKATYTPFEKNITKQNTEMTLVVTMSGNQPVEETPTEEIPTEKTPVEETPTITLPITGENVKTQSILAFLGMITGMIILILTRKTKQYLAEKTKK